MSGIKGHNHSALAIAIFVHQFCTTKEKIFIFCLCFNLFLEFQKSKTLQTNWSMAFDRRARLPGREGLAKLSCIRGDVGSRIFGA